MSRLLNSLSLRHLCLFALAFLWVSDAAAQKRRDVNVYVFTAADPSGFVTPSMKELGNSAADFAALDTPPGRIEIGA